MVENDGTDAYPRRRAFALGLARVGGSALFSTVFLNIIIITIKTNPFNRCRKRNVTMNFTKKWSRDIIVMKS
jgi:hypothetical protein